MKRSRVKNRPLRITELLSLFLCLLFAAPLAGEDGGAAEESMSRELQKLLERVDEANRELETVAAAIRYTRAIPLLDESESSCGRLFFRAPNKIHLTLAEPRNEEMVSDGGTWWIVDHNARQVEVYATDAALPVAETAFLKFGYGGGVKDLEEEYRIRLLSVEETEPADEESGRRRKRWLLELLPADEEAPARYERMEFEITQELYLPETMVLYESDGEIVHRFELENIEINGEPAPSRFVYDIPRGYTVIRP